MKKVRIKFDRDIKELDFAILEKVSGISGWAYLPLEREMLIWFDDGSNVETVSDFDDLASEEKGLLVTFLNKIDKG